MAHKYLTTHNKELNRELPGAIAGFIVFAFLVAISYVLGMVHILALGWGDMIMGLLIAGLIGYGYAIVNRKRRYDAVMGLMLVGYVVGAYIIEPLMPEGQFVANLADSTAQVSFLIWIFTAIFFLVILIAPFYFAKRTQLH